MKPLFICFLISAIVLSCCVPVAAQPVVLPNLSAQSAVLINAEDGSVYFSKNADSRMGMASTTKLMTALVAVETCLPQTPIVIPSEAVGVEGSSVYLTEGECLTLEELLYALLLSSANDAATAIALSLDGSIEAFAKRMNDRAAMMGLTNTHFTNPHGLYDEDHYTTAAELAKIAAEVLAHPLLREIVATYKTTIPHNGQPDLRLLVNHNKLLRTYEGAIGMKTGYTQKTGRTLVSAAQRDGLTLIAVTLNAPNDWQDHTALLDYGFSRYEAVVFASPGTFCCSAPVTGGISDTVMLTNAEPLTLTLPKGYKAPVYTIQRTSRFLFAPVQSGGAYGTVTISCEGKAVSSVLVAAQEIPDKQSSAPSLWERIKKFFIAR